MGLLRDILQEKSHDEIRHTEEISQALLDRMKEMEKEWGVEFLEARLTSCAPNSNSAQILSSKTSAAIKAEAAKSAAGTLGGTVVDLQSLLAAVIGTPVMTNAGMTFKMMTSPKQKNGDADSEEDH